MTVLDNYTYICSIFEYNLYIDPILHPYGHIDTHVHVGVKFELHREAKQVSIKVDTSSVNQI
jgi:hypothetical protein